MRSLLALIVLSLPLYGCATASASEDDFIPAIATGFALATLDTSTPVPSPVTPVSECKCKGAKTIVMPDGNRVACQCGASCTCKAGDVSLTPEVPAVTLANWPGGMFRGGCADGSCSKPAEKSDPNAKAPAAKAPGGACTDGSCSSGETSGEHRRFGGRRGGGGIFRGRLRGGCSSCG